MFFEHFIVIRLFTLCIVCSNFSSGTLLYRLLYIFLKLFEISLSVHRPSTTLDVYLLEFFIFFIVFQKSLNDLFASFWAVLSKIILSLSFFTCFIAQ